MSASDGRIYFNQFGVNAGVFKNLNQIVAVSSDASGMVGVSTGLGDCDRLIQAFPSTVRI